MIVLFRPSDSTGLQADMMTTRTIICESSSLLHPKISFETLSCKEETVYNRIRNTATLSGPELDGLRWSVNCPVVWWVKLWSSFRQSWTMHPPDWRGQRPHDTFKVWASICDGSVVHYSTWHHKWSARSEGTLMLSNIYRCCCNFCWQDDTIFMENLCWK